MEFFWLEFLHFVAALLAIVVSASLAFLFYITQRLEGSTKSLWRSIGFSLLAISFFLFILARRFSEVEFSALFVQLIAFVTIFIGVLVEPTLSQLIKISNVRDLKAKLTEQEVFRITQSTAVKLLSFTGIIVIISWGFPYVRDRIVFGEFVDSSLAILAMLFVGGTMVLQTRRLIIGRQDRVSRLQNLYPLLSYVFLFVRGIFQSIIELPETDIVFIEQITFQTSITFQLLVISTIVGFVFLGFWTWNFVKPRFFLRTFVSFMGIASIVSSLGALIFTILMFNVVRADNARTMSDAAESQALVMEDRANTALILARALAQDVELITVVSAENRSQIDLETEGQLLTSGVDILRVYDTNGLVIASPSDERDVGFSFANDAFVMDVVETNRGAKTFDIEEHVLSPVLVARGIYPIIDGSNNAGAVEVAYKFDTAFVDFSKARTSLDVTIFTEERRSATTLLLLDGVSRWVGTVETNDMVLQDVLENGETISLVVDRLGRSYFSAFVPVKNFHGEVIGMVSVGTPTFNLIEDSREQLITVFLITTLISIFGALLGYYISPSPFSILLSKATTPGKTNAAQRMVESDTVQRKVKKIKEDVKSGTPKQTKEDRTKQAASNVKKRVEDIKKELRK